MIEIQRATSEDLDFMLWVDEQEEGYAHDEELSPAQQAHQRAKFESFLTTPDRAAWIALDGDSGVRAGLVMCIFRDLSESGSGTPGNEFYRGLPDLSKVGRFCEVFELWVHPDFRRQGLATRLKKQLEIESVRRGIGLIYTHTRSVNDHVVELNLKMGYREIRRGPIWDDVERISLIKDFKE